ncbi:T9SS type A sorting domain-containing protein [Tamlana fucoidanivorans]|uniref:T9SS type A sorting domain-containing protein n=1 Tax=Allotamlana fucoidanivorans TaxID=2583814 RepID=A0A5C4SLT2_9FLAO|nr:T9SS type A sorting domain-containing protein [Tamlana fucoidanivorans]TNJ44959.1 T9SS type A sorting domain-containing protein [Tamlana fucoidanivorans]
MKIKVLLLFLILIIQSNAQDYPFNLPDNIEATLNLKTDSQEPFNNLLLGTNIHHFSTNQEKDFVKLFNPISVRFPHGLWANWYDWRRDVSRLFGEEKFEYKQGVDDTPRMKEVDFLANLYIFDNNNIKVGIDGLTALNSERKSNTGKGFSMMWTFNMSADGTDFNNGCQESVARYQDLINRGFEVKDVEMGNENFYPGQRSSIIPNAEDYIARAKSMSAALKELDPNIRVSIPLLRRDSWANPNWNSDLTVDQSYFDAVTIHTYVGSDPDDASNSDEAFSTALTARKHLLASITDYPRKVTNKPIWLTEWGVKSGGPNAVSALGAVDCFLMMSENQDIFERANWFSTNGKLNSMLVWEEYIDGQGKIKERIKYPLEKTLFGSAYEITRSILENSTLIGSDMQSPNLIEGVKAVSARVVWKDGKATVLALNLTDKDVVFNVSVDGGSFTDTYIHKAMAFSAVDEERAVPYNDSPLSLIKEGTGQIILPKLSINTIALSGVDFTEVLPSNNFNIETISETCTGRNNGKLIINTLRTRNYSVQIAGLDYSFTKDITIENLNPGNYSFCITVDGEDFKQCFSLEIESGNSISGKIAQNKDKATITIESGEGPYVVIKNGNLLMTTNQKYIEIDVAHGDEIDVKAKADCQGKLSKKINMLENILAYPNPSKGVFDIYIPNDFKEVSLHMFNVYGQLISNQVHTVKEGRVHIDISNKPAGIYFVKVGLENKATVKIIKQ